MSVAELPPTVTYAARVRLAQRERAKPHRVRIEAQLHALLDRLEDLRQEAIARLDELHGDPDLEPSLAGLTAATAWGGGNTDDREGDDEREADSADAEPALGAPEGGPSGCRWGGRYWQTSDEEEPSLGSVGDRDQRRWAQGAPDDIEEEHDGREPETDENLTAYGVRWFSHEGKTTWPPAAALEEALEDQQRQGGIRSWNLPPAEEAK